MTYSIYSIGDAAFLEDVLIAISSYTGSGDFSILGSIGLGLAFLVAGFQGIAGGGKGISYPQIVVSFLLYQGMFGPTVDVAIQDVYTGAVRPVSDVPFGVAATGTIISTIGYSITRDFEQAFSTPKMTSNGFGAALETIKKIRINSLDHSGISLTNSATLGADFLGSWENYIRDCTSVKISLDSSSRDVIENGTIGTSSIDTLKFENYFHYTKFNLGSGAQEKLCVEAHEDLKVYTETVFLPYYKEKFLANILGVSALEVDGVISDALTGLGIDQPIGGGNPVDEFIIASILQAAYYKGWQARHIETKSFSYATAISDAMKQREMQWMGQGTLFREYVHPTMTFIEGFMFSATPFLGFVLTLGEFGIKLAGKYLYLLVWVQMWTPVMAIVNMYINRTVTGAFENLEGASINIFSIAGMMHADRVVQKWMATGEMLASSVPALTLVLLYGSSYTMTHLSSRMNATDTFDEKKVSPDTYNSVPLISQVSNLSSSPSSGITSSSSPLLESKLSFSQGTNANIESARNAAESATQSLTSAVSKGFSTMAENGISAQEYNAITNSEALEKSHAFKAFDSWASKNVEGWEGTDSKTQGLAFSAYLQGGVTGGLKFANKLLGMKAGLNASAGMKGEGQKGWDEKEVEKLATSMEHAFSRREDLDAKVSEGLKHDFNQQAGTAQMLKDAGVKSEQITDAASKASSASKSYNEAVSSFGGGSINSQYTFAEAGLIMKDKGMLSDVQSAVGMAGGSVKADQERFFSELNNPNGKNFIANDIQREITSGLLALENNPNNLTAQGLSDNLMSKALFGASGFGTGIDNSALGGLHNSLDGPIGVGTAAKVDSVFESASSQISTARSTTQEGIGRFHDLEAQADGFVNDPGNVMGTKETEQQQRVSATETKIHGKADIIPDGALDTVGEAVSSVVGSRPHERFKPL